jgi:hypothetical protein
MIFPLEKELSFTFQDKFIGGFSSEKEGYFRTEFHIGNIIPDIIILNFHDNLYKDFFCNFNFSIKHSFIISILRKYEKLELYKLCKICSSTEDRMNSYIKDLEKLKILKSNNSRISLSNEFLQMNFEIITFELKLTDINRAIDQAISYRTFSDKSIIIMDKDIINKGTDTQKIINMIPNEIGFYCVDRNEKYMVKEPFQKDYEFSYEREYILGSLLSKRSQKLWSRLI